MFVVVVVVLSVSYDLSVVVYALTFAEEKVALVRCCFMLMMYGY